MDRVADFKVKYKFYTEAEGGRKVTPFQGYRSDWLFDGDDPLLNGIYMIWPIFIYNDGKYFEKDSHVPQNGLAEMHIISPAMEEVKHRKRIIVGAKGYFMEGSKKVAEASISEIVGLNVKT